VVVRPSRLRGSSWNDRDGVAGRVTFGRAEEQPLERTRSDQPRNSRTDDPVDDQRRLREDKRRMLKAARSNGRIDI